MLKVIEDLRIKIFKSKALVFLILVALPLLTASIFNVDKTQANRNKDKEVLAVVTKASLVTPKPSPATVSTPTPTLVPAPSASSTQTPTPTPIVSTPISTPRPTAAIVNSPTPAATPTLTPTLTPAPTATPTPAGFNLQIGIDYAGQKSPDSYTVSVNPGQTAWDAVAKALGINNLQYTDYGGTLGIFITGLNGVSASPNQYFEFRVNGVSSSVGVSTYNCNDGDKLDFVLTTF